MLSGSLVPGQLEDLPARRLVGPIHFCNLDCPDGVLAERLRARPAWRDSSAEAKIVEHQRFATWLRARMQPTFATSALSADEVASRVANWIRPLLPGPGPERLSTISPAT